MRAGLEAAARRYDEQRASVERRLAADEADKAVHARYNAWAHDNRAHAAGLRLMALQFAKRPELELLSAADGDPGEPSADYAHLAKLLRTSIDNAAVLQALLSNNLNTILAALDRASRSFPVFE
jgi:hypothetical protein